MKDTITIKGKTYTRAEWREHCEQLKKQAGERNRARNETLEREAEENANHE